MSWRTPSYFIAAASASLSMTAWKAPMSETSMLRPTRPGFSGSTKVRISLATESNTSARLGTKANGRHRRLRGLRSDSACECPSFERFAGTQTSKDGTRRPRPAPREDGVKPGRTPVVPLPVVFAAGATRRPATRRAGCAVLAHAGSMVWPQFCACYSGRTLWSDRVSREATILTGRYERRPCRDRGRRVGGRHQPDPRSVA